MRIPFNKPFIAGKELDYIWQAVITNSHLSGDGPFTQRCQQWLEHKLGSNKVLLTTSCTAALEMAAILCNIQAGDEVIMPSYTFVSTANAFVLRGATPVFIDIREDTMNIDETLIEKAITSKTKAIVPVHYAGRACAMDKIMEIAGRHGLCVIEDSAQALLSSFKGQYLGTIGNMGCLSFHETKNIISGEGGALLLNDEKLYERAEIIWEKGTNRKKFFKEEISKYTWVDIGSSYLPSEIIAAFLYAQLEHAEDIIKKRRSIWLKYLKKLMPLVEANKIKLPTAFHENNYNGHIFYLLAKSSQERNDLLKHLNKHGVNAIFHYIPLHSSPAGQKYGKIGSKLVVTDNISERIVRLPLYYEMTDDDIDNVVQFIYRFYQTVPTMETSVI